LWASSLFCLIQEIRVKFSFLAPLGLTENSRTLRELQEFSVAAANSNCQNSFYLLNRDVQFDFHFGQQRSVGPEASWLMVGAQRVRFHLVRHHRARRYVLRLREDGSARVTIPRRGSVGEARKFVQRNLEWLEKQLLRQARQARQSRYWEAGTEILFRGKAVRLEAVRSNGGTGCICIGTEVVGVGAPEGDLRPMVERHLWRLAAKELRVRVQELATLHKFSVQRVSVRNQRSRWGSCSRHGTISLNWRLVQTPEFVRDYIILHELAHLRQMNHSSRFWREVARLCPNYNEAEKWLKANSGLLR
jgi:predicted metal-dependent hydrolase